MVICVELVVLSQLLMLCMGTTYSNVHSLNALRLGGLLAAAVNGIYAAFVLWYYRDDPAGKSPCSAALDVFGSSSGNLSLADITPVRDRLVQDYAAFGGLVVANALALGIGARFLELLLLLYYFARVYYALTRHGRGVVVLRA